MEDLFFKYHWEEEDILFYVQYRGNWPFRQIEISPKITRWLSADNPIEYESMLGDQPLDRESLEGLTPISKDEFEEIWDKKL